MEKLKTLNLCLVTSYIVVLGFKIVARSLDRASANQRWILFLEMIDLMDIPAATKIALRKYFVDEWWCDKWRMAWLDVSRLPLIEGGQRTMTTNNNDENLNLQVADCIGSRRKKISTLVTELTGKKKQVHRPWCYQEKVALFDAFSFYIGANCRRLPGKNEIIKIQADCKALANRTWLNIKYQLKNMQKTK